MPSPHVRRDGYGRPLPELAEASQEVLLERPQNQVQRRFVQQLLEAQYREVLRRGVHAAVSVRFMVVDGTMQPDIEVSVLRRWRQEERS